MDLGKRKPKILFVEDDLSLSAVYTLRMQAEGFTVFEVNNGTTALQVAKDFKPDLVLCDLMMPDVSGFEVIDMLRNTEETGQAKIVVLSALSAKEDIARAKQLGADEYFVKSQIAIGEVMTRLRELTGLPPAE